MSHRRLLFYTAAGALASACASAPPATTTASTPSPTPRAEQSTSGGGWTGSFQPKQERTGIVAPTKLQKATGTVRLRESPQDPRRTKVSLVLSLNVQEPTQLRWALIPGRCGSGSLPLMGYEQFPVLEVGSSGRGQLDVDLPMPLPESGQYHVDIYSGGTQPDNVVTCATLRRA